MADEKFGVGINECLFSMDALNWSKVTKTFTMLQKISI